MTASSTGARVSYAELARLFARLSAAAFGGPIAHLALIEDEVVTRRKWITREHFLDVVAATNLIPGPNSTETMIHIGYTMRGIPGALVAGFCFITPAFLITLALAVLYVSSGTIPEMEALLWGIKPVIISVILVAAYRLVPTALKNRLLWLTAIAAGAVIALLDLPEALVMIGAGIVYAVMKVGVLGGGGFTALLLIAVQPSVQIAAQAAEGARAGLWEIFAYFVKVGSVLFGSGYVLVTFLQRDLVEGFGWLSAREMLDAIAIGQLTPGPVLTATTVVGYILAGLPGAVLATVGVFLPSFVLVILTAPLIPRMRRSRWMGAFLSGVNAAVVAAIVVTVVGLIGEALRPLNGADISVGGVSPLALLLAVGALIALIRWRVNATWVIAAGGAIGLLLGLLGGG